MASDDTPLATAIPTPRQLEFQDWEFGIFLHFGIRTFYEGHRDWDGKPMHPSEFKPSALDCTQWVKTAAEAGAKYMVLTAKHHDGFANWPSAHTDFSVASSPWKGGAGDVVAEFTAACHAHGMKVGLYYSPADWKCPSYEDEKAYDDYFISQVSEILKPYGQIDMLWFDGCGSEGHSYDWERIIGEVRTMQPAILIFNMGDPDYRWVGNEAGIAPLPVYNTVKYVPKAVDTENLDDFGTARWLPAECDCMMRLRNWFYSDSDIHTVKSLDELLGLYYLSVGRGCNLLLNIGPDRRGLLPDEDAARLLELGSEVKRRFGQAVVDTDAFQRDGNAWTFTSEEGVLVDHVVLQEDLVRGEHVRRFVVRAAAAHVGTPVIVHEGYNIGHKAICRFPAVKAQRLVVELTELDGDVELRSLRAYHAGM
jgi:alpha-L-fucosidase